MRTKNIINSFKSLGFFLIPIIGSIITYKNEYGLWGILVTIVSSVACLLLPLTVSLFTLSFVTLFALIPYISYNTNIIIIVIASGLCSIITIEEEKFIKKINSTTC